MPAARWLSACLAACCCLDWECASLRHLQHAGPDEAAWPALPWLGGVEQAYERYGVSAARPEAWQALCVCFG